MFENSSQKEQLHQAIAEVLQHAPSFRAQRGMQLEGPDVAVRVVAWYPDPENRDFCNLEVSVLTFGLPDDTPDEVVAGARKAYEARRNDPDERVREAVAMALDQLDAPRIRAADLEGLELTLTVEGETKQTVTQQTGRALFRNVPTKAECRVAAFLQVGDVLPRQDTMVGILPAWEPWLDLAAEPLRQMACTPTEALAVAKSEEPSRRFQKDFPEGTLSLEERLDRDHRRVLDVYFRPKSQDSRPPTFICLKLTNTGKQDGPQYIPLKDARDGLYWNKLALDDFALAERELQFSCWPIFGSKAKP